MDYINYIDGTWEKTSNSYVPLYDSGFLLGDGLFETIRFDNKTLFKPEKHLIRLYESIDYTDINIQERPKKLLNLLKSIITKNNLTSGLLRLMVTRGNLKGAPWLFNGPAKIYISIRPLTPIEKKPVKVVFFSENKYPIIRFKPAIKSLNYLGNMITGSADTSQLGGPIRIAKVTGQVAEYGIIPFLSIMAYISISLGLINLFPIPLLDGGHLMFYFFEKILGRPLSQKTQEGFFRIGMFLLLSLMFFATFNDLKDLGLF